MAIEMKNMEIEEFMSGPLVSWFKSCLNNEKKLTYKSIVDGVLIHDVLLQMGLESVADKPIVPSVGCPDQRLRNLRTILACLLDFYGHSVQILEVPDIGVLGLAPKQHVREARRLLLLLLGCAVQCPKRADFVERIRCRLDQPTQAALADCIAKVVSEPEVQEAAEDVSRVYLEHEPSMLEHSTPRKETRPRLEQSAELGSDLDVSLDEQLRQRETELLKWKSRVMTNQDQLKERAEDLAECKGQLSSYKQQLARLQKENDRLGTLFHALEVRNCKSYRDELDAATEKAAHVDRLEQEVIRYKERLAGFDDFKSRLEELRENNLLLEQSNAMLAEQASAQRAKAEKTSLEFEKEIFELQQELQEVRSENERRAERNQELYEENFRLERLVKTTMKEALKNDAVPDLEDSATSFIAQNNSLSEQLADKAQSKALKLELENRRLSNLVDSLKEGSEQESSSRLLELENEKQQLNQTIDSLREDMMSQTRCNEELESTFQEALEDNEQLYKKLMSERSQKFKELNKQHAAVLEHQEQLETMLESAQKRAGELECSLLEANKKLDERKAIAAKESLSKQRELESKIALLESQKRSALEETERQRELAAEATLSLETTSKLAKELESRLEEIEMKNEDSSKAVAKLEEILSSVGCSDTGEDGSGDIKEEDKFHLLIKKIQEHSQLKVINSQLLAAKAMLLSSQEKLSNENDNLRALYERLKVDFLKLLRERNSELNAERAQEKQEKAREEPKSSEPIDDELNKLKDDFTKLCKVNEGLTGECRKVNAALVICRRELRNKRARSNELELDAKKLERRCEILRQINEKLEGDKSMMLDHVNHLLKQNHNLVAQMIEDRERFHSEELKNNDKLTDLRRQKEKLELKIMEHYRQLENCPASSKSKNKRNMVKIRETLFRLRRAGSELFGRNRRSWAEAAATADDFEYVSGRDSSVSLEISRLSPEPRHLDLSEQPTGLMNPRRVRVSDFGLCYPPRRKLSVLANFFEDGLRSKSRKTIDFLGTFENDDQEDEDDRTLSSDSTSQDDMKDENGFPIDKLVDLSFEDETTMPKDNDFEENSSERSSDENNLNDSGDEKKMSEAEKSSKDSWEDYGCA